MKRQRNKFWNFCLACMPGAGQMYLGFFKQGISLMTIFMGCCALISLIGVDAIAFALPIVWFYAFFDAINKNSLPADQFEKLEDDWLFIKNTDQLKLNFKKVRIVVAVILILIGINSLYNGALSFCIQLGIDLDNTAFGLIIYVLPKVVFSVLIIGVGIYLIIGKRKSIYENINTDEKDLDKDLNKYLYKDLETIKDEIIEKEKDENDEILSD